MGDYIKVAWRNLNRNLLRTFIAVLAIAVVVMIVVFSRGIILSFGDRMNDTYINNTLGHVKIVSEEYRQREVLLSLDYPLDGFQGEGLTSMLAEIETRDEVEYLLPRLKFGALYGGGEDMVGMMGMGIDTDSEIRHGTISADLTWGRMPETGNEIVVGSGLLQELGVEPGGRITIMFSDAFQSLRARTFEVVGVRESGFSALDDGIFYLPLITAQDMLGMEDQATEILAFASDRGRAGMLAGDLRELFNSMDDLERYSILPWEKADPFIELFLEMDIIYDVIYAAFVFMGSIVVISTMTMIIRERRTEIGMMSALGMKSSDVMKIFTLEGAFIGLIGSLTGALGGGLLNFYLARDGIHVQALVDTMEGIDALVDPVFYPVHSLENVIVSFSFGFIIVTLACLYPAWKASRLDPVEALKVDA